MVKIVSWNINKSRVAVRELLEMDADVALLQEAGVGALDDLRSSGPAVAVSPQEPWEPWPRDAFDRWPVVVELSDRVEVEWFEEVLPSTPWLGQRRMAAGNVGTIAVAKIIPTGDGAPFIAVSMYARCLRPHHQKQVQLLGRVGASDHLGPVHVHLWRRQRPSFKSPHPGRRGLEQHLWRNRGQRINLVRPGPQRVLQDGGLGVEVHGTSVSQRAAGEPDPTGSAPRNPQRSHLSHQSQIPGHRREPIGLCVRV